MTQSQCYVTKVATEIKKRSKNIYCLTPIYYKSVNATFCVRLYKII